MIERLGLEPPVSKPFGKSAAALYQQCIQKVTDQFRSYVGENPISNLQKDCNNCKLICETVKRKLPAVSSKADMYFMLTTLPQELTIPKVMEEYNVTSYIARKASVLRTNHGPFAAPSIRKPGRVLDDAAIDTVVQWYLSD